MASFDQKPPIRGIPIIDMEPIIMAAEVTGSLAARPPMFRMSWGSKSSWWSCPSPSWRWSWAWCTSCITEPLAMKSIPFAMAWLNRWNMAPPKTRVAASVLPLL